MIILFILLINVLTADPLNNILTSEWDSAWPGLTFSTTPTLVVREGKVTPYNWNGGEITQDLSQISMNPHMEVNGQDSFVFNMGKGNDLFPLVHERFHLFQFAHFEPGPKGKYVDIYNAENLAMMHIEDSLLEAFEKQPKSEELIKDYLAVRFLRETLISEETKEWEDHQERMEGLADYVAARVLSVPIHLKGNRPFIEQVTKWRYYSVGAIEGDMLDYLEADWKMDASRGVSLKNLLDRYSPEERELRFQRASRVLKEYNYDRIVKEMEQIVADYQENLQKCMSDFEKQEGKTIHLERPRRIAGGGKAMKIVILEEGKSMTIRDNSRSSTASGDWVLETNNLGYILSDKGFKVFKAENDMKLVADGETVNLIGNKDIQFSDISWVGKHQKFKCSRPGRLVVENDQVWVYFN